MRSYFLASAVVGLAVAAPAPQDIDFDLAYALPNPTFTEAVGVTDQIVTYNPTTILSAAASQITASNTNTAVVVTTDAASNQKRAVSACASQPVGYGPTPSVDSPAAFKTFGAFADAANGASTPPGYVQQFVNLDGSNNAYGYLGYTTLKTYDVNLCASKCNAINGCISINIYFERDPSVEPGSGNSGCANPPSTTTIKCAFWGGPVGADSAVNTGQFRNQFQVVIAGSNGYTNSSVASISGYSSPVPLGNAAINAPYDEYGFSSYMGNTIFIGAFNASLCAAACSQKSAYNLRHPPTDGTPVQTCQFFNTYILYINQTSNVQGQYCAMYSESWGPKYATNNGQYRGNDHFLIEYSYAYSNATDPGKPCADCAVHQATSAISRSTLQPYCSTYLGYTTPVSTQTVVAYTTPLTTVSSTVVTSVTTTTTATSYVSINAKRALATPSALTQYPSAILSSACSLVATPVTSTSIVTTTATSTTGTSTLTTVTTSTVSAVSTATAVCNTSPGNVIFNGDFSSNQLTPWYVNSQSGNGNVDTSGSTLAENYNNGGGPYASIFIRQNVTLCPGVTYQVDFDYMYSNGENDVYIYGEVFYSDGSSYKYFGARTRDDGGAQGQFKHFSGSFVATTGVAYFQMGGVAAAYESLTATFDNFVLKRQ